MALANQLRVVMGQEALPATVARAAVEAAALTEGLEQEELGVEMPLMPVLMAEGQPIRTHLLAVAMEGQAVSIVAAAEEQVQAVEE